MKPKTEEAKVLSVINRKGEKFKIGDKIFFMGKIEGAITAFRTDSPMPNWLTTRMIMKPTYWIMARIGNRHWVNIDMATKKKKTK